MVARAQERSRQVVAPLGADVLLALVHIHTGVKVASESEAGRAEALWPARGRLALVGAHVVLTRRR